MPRSKKQKTTVISTPSKASNPFVSVAKVIPEPVVKAPASVVEAPEPVVKAPVDAVVEAPVSVVEAPEPVVEAPVDAVVEAPVDAVVEAPVDAPEPVVEPSSVTEFITGPISFEEAPEPKEGSVTVRDIILCQSQKPLDQEGSKIRLPRESTVEEFGYLRNGLSTPVSVPCIGSGITVPGHGGKVKVRISTLLHPLPNGIMLVRSK